MLKNKDCKLFNTFPLCENLYGETIMIIQSTMPMDYLFEQLGVVWEEFKQDYVVSQNNYSKGGTMYNLGYNL